MSGIPAHAFRRTGDAGRSPAAPSVSLLLGTLLVTGALSGCQGPDAEAAFRRGDYEGALGQWTERATAGDAVAENYLGIHYQFGLGVPRDPAAASQWYRRAALRGNPDAQRNLGTLYQKGLGVAHDNQRAYGWYHYAARQGNRAAVAYMESMTGELTPNQIMQAKQIVGRELGDPGLGRPLVTAPAAAPDIPAAPDQGEP